MRLFTAVDLPTDILLRLERLISSLRNEAFIKWSPLDNLHITTKFIGEWPESRIQELDEALRALPPRQPFEVELKGLGWFPNDRSPRVLWVGVYASPELAELADQTSKALEPLGIKPEDREFSPHMTIARIKNPVPLSGLKQRVAELQGSNWGRFVANEFSLFDSQPGSNASIYRKVRNYQFAPALAAAYSAP
jgi:2'-5' RNA ligase